MRKALLAGCNQYRWNQLQGCINDIILMQQWLHQNGWKSSEITLLLDKDMTAAKLKSELKKLLKGNKPGDTIIFWYSGHGAEITSTDPAESDGLNETLCPVNFSFSKPNTWVTDKFLRDILPQPKGINLLMGLDSCFSGGMDKTLTRKKVIQPPSEMKAAIARAKTQGKGKTFKSLSTGLIWAGCLENQTCADTEFNGIYNGAFTYYFHKNIDSTTPVSEINKKIIHDLSPDYEQIPIILGTKEILGAALKI